MSASDPKRTARFRSRFRFERWVRFAGTRAARCLAPFENNRRTYGADQMSIDRIVLAFAGTIILLSLALSQIHSPYWLWLTAFAGANML
jgi:hypothetical protein